MDKIYVCVRYDHLKDESTLQAVKVTDFTGDNGRVHLTALNKADSIQVKGKLDIGTRKVAKLTF